MDDLVHNLSRVKKDPRPEVPVLSAITGAKFLLLLVLLYLDFVLRAHLFKSKKTTSNLFGRAELSIIWWQWGGGTGKRRSCL